MSAITSIWNYVEKQIILRNRNMPLDELERKMRKIAANGRFLTDFPVSAQKFNVSVEGQAIEFLLYYEPLLNCWKCNLKDALGNNILSDATLLAGQNIVDGLRLKYKSTNDQNEETENELTIKGLFVTEPLNGKFEKISKGVESTKLAFARDSLGNCPCALLYFSDQEAATLYAKLINGQQPEINVGLEDMDYQVVIPAVIPEED